MTSMLLPGQSWDDEEVKIALENTQRKLEASILELTCRFEDSSSSLSRTEADNTDKQLTKWYEIFDNSMTTSDNKMRHVIRCKPCGRPLLLTSFSNHILYQCRHISSDDRKRFLLDMKQNQSIEESIVKNLDENQKREQNSIKNANQNRFQGLSEAELRLIIVQKTKSGRISNSERNALLCALKNARIKKEFQKTNRYFQGTPQDAHALMMKSESQNAVTLEKSLIELHGQDYASLRSQSSAARRRVPSLIPTDAAILNSPNSAPVLRRKPTPAANSNAVTDSDGLDKSQSTDLVTSFAEKLGTEFDWARVTQLALPPIPSVRDHVARDARLAAYSLPRHVACVSSTHNATENSSSSARTSTGPNSIAQSSSRTNLNSSANSHASLFHALLTLRQKNWKHLYTTELRYMVPGNLPSVRIPIFHGQGFFATPGSFHTDIRLTPRPLLTASVSMPPPTQTAKQGPVQGSQATKRGSNLMDAMGTASSQSLSQSSQLQSASKAGPPAKRAKVTAKATTNQVATPRKTMPKGKSKAEESIGQLAAALAPPQVVDHSWTDPKSIQAQVATMRQLEKGAVNAAARNFSAHQNTALRNAGQQVATQLAAAQMSSIEASNQMFIQPLLGSDEASAASGDFSRQTSRGGGRGAMRGKNTMSAAAARGRGRMNVNPVRTDGLGTSGASGAAEFNESFNTELSGQNNAQNFVQNSPSSTTVGLGGRGGRAIRGGRRGGSVNSSPVGSKVQAQQQVGDMGQQILQSAIGSGGTVSMQNQSPNQLTKQQMLARQRQLQQMQKQQQFSQQQQLQTQQQQQQMDLSTDDLPPTDVIALLEAQKQQIAARAMANAQKSASAVHKRQAAVIPEAPPARMVVGANDSARAPNSNARKNQMTPNATRNQPMQLPQPQQGQPQQGQPQMTEVDPSGVDMDTALALLDDPSLRFEDLF